MKCLRVGKACISARRTWGGLAYPASYDAYLYRFAGLQRRVQFRQPQRRAFQKASAASQGPSPVSDRPGHCCRMCGAIVKSTGVAPNSRSGCGFGNG